MAKAKALMNTTKILSQTTTELNLIEKNQHMKIAKSLKGLFIKVNLMF